MKKVLPLLLCILLLAGCKAEDAAYTPTGKGFYVEGQEATEPKTDQKDDQFLVLPDSPDVSLNP